MKAELNTQPFISLILARRSQEGFTLLELLVVMIIIGMLSAIAMPSFLSQSNKARQAEAKTYVGAINRAQQAHFTEKSAFGTLTDLAMGLSDSRNYTYDSVPSGAGTSAIASTTAVPIGTVRGYAGRVWIGVMSDGNATSWSIVCEGTPTAVPTIVGTVCP